MSGNKQKAGVSIQHIEPDSPAHECGFRAGDILLSVNGNQINDAIDYMYHRGGEELEIIVSRGGKKFSCIIEKDEYDDPGIVPAPIDVTSCRNKCVFCFVHQQPKGLRRSLYLRDDDYRMSFLYGNYITLTNLSQKEKERILSQRLSPLYISVHATDPDVRARMLGSPSAPDIIGELRVFTEAGIRLHTQIVLCPGYNDGVVLSRTIEELGSLGPMLLSLAVVPVGLTAHRRTELREVTGEDASAALAAIEGFQREFLKERGSRLVYAADELYIKAGRKRFPALTEYEELPQIENGVGMVSLFKDDARRIRIKTADIPKRPVKCLTFTGESFYPHLKKFTDRLNKRGLSITPVRIDNDFFGRSVTVAGLLTGADVIRQLNNYAQDYDRLVIPDVVLREGEYDFLDDVGVNELASALGLETLVVESSPYGLLDGVL